MKRASNRFTALVVVILTVVLALPAVQMKAATKVKISAKSATIYVGSTKTLSLTGAEGSDVKWTTSNKKIATVTSKGKVKGIKKGNAVITATYKGKEYTCKIKVKKPYLNYTIANLYVGDSIDLVLNGTVAKKWKSSNTDVVTVKTGKVVAVGEGTATVTVTGKDKKKYKSKVTVNATSGNSDFLSSELKEADVTIEMGENSKELSGIEKDKILSLLKKLKKTDEKTFTISKYYDWYIDVGTKNIKMNYARVSTSKGWMIIDARSYNTYMDLPELDKAVAELMASNEADYPEEAFVGYTLKCPEPVTEAEYLETASEMLTGWLDKMKGTDIDDYYRNTGFKIEDEDKSAYLACGMVNGRKEFVCELCFTALDCDENSFYDSYHMSGSYTRAGKGWDGNYICARFAWENGKCTVLRIVEPFNGYDIVDGLNGIPRNGYKNFFEFSRRADMEKALEENYAPYDWARNIVSSNLTQTSDGIPVNINIYPDSITTEDEDSITGIWDFSSGMNGEVVYSTGVYFTDNATGHMDDTLPRNFKLVFDNYDGDANPDYCIRYMNDEDGTYYTLERLINDGRVLRLSGRAFEGGIYVAGCFEPSIRLQKADDIDYIGWKKENDEYYPTDTNGRRIEIPDLNMYSDRYYLPGDMKNYSQEENMVTCFLWNNTEKEVTTDAEYSIEIYEKGQWRTISKGLKIKSVNVSPRGYVEITYDISSLTERKHTMYRIVQNCGKLMAYGKFICEGEEVSDFSVDVQPVPAGMYSATVSVLGNNMVMSPEIKKAIVKTDTSEVGLSVLKISDKKYQLISPDFPRESGTYTLILNDAVKAEMKIIDVEEGLEIVVDVEKLEDGVVLNINSPKNLVLDNVYILKKSINGYEVLAMRPDETDIFESVTDRIIALEPYSLKLVDLTLNYYSDAYILSYFETLSELDDDLKKYYYDEFGLPKDATKEDFYKAFVNMYCYTPEGEYMAAVSLTTESGESIALLHLFE